MSALEVFDGPAERVARQRNQIIHQTDLQIAGQQAVQRLADPGEVAGGVEQRAAGDQHAFALGRQPEAGAAALAQAKTQPGFQRGRGC